jgi:hypothetical protein
MAVRARAGAVLAGIAIALVATLFLLRGSDGIGLHRVWPDDPQVDRIPLLGGGAIASPPSGVGESPRVRFVARAGAHTTVLLAETNVP